MRDLVAAVREAILAGDEQDTRKLVGECLDNNLERNEIVEESMIPAIEIIGEALMNGEAFLPELIMAAEAMREGLKVLGVSHACGNEHSHRVLLGTVSGDIHCIGKSLVCTCMEAAGFEVLDMGEDVSTEKFVAEYEKKKPDILGLSAFLSTNRQVIPQIVKAIRAVDPSALIMIGGACVTQDFANKVGASAYAPNATGAVFKAKELLQQRSSAMV